MTQPKTLLQLAGVEPTPAPLGQSTLIIIDAQNEYVDGPVALPGVEDKIAEIARLLARARAGGSPIVHIQHLGRPGGLFDPEHERSHIVDELAPRDDETVVLKGLPNGFANTDLNDVLRDKGKTSLLVTGFMTHMCVSSTVRSALDHGFSSTVVASATGTRSLPDATGGAPIDADTLHRAGLAGLSDRFATIAPDADSVPD